jgi:hypothetical protein
MPGKSNILPHLVLHLIMVIFLAFPVWVTSLLPTTWIDLKRNGNQVNMEATIRLLFVIPFQRVRIEKLEEAGTKSGTIKVNETEGPKMLVLRGIDATAELPVSMRSASKLENRINGFLASTDSELSLRSTAHPGISIFCGVWAAIFISIYILYLVSWLVPHRLQWKVFDRVIGWLPVKSRIRTEIEARRHEFENH